MQLERDGAELAAAAVTADLGVLRDAFDSVREGAGTRLRNAGALRPLLARTGSIGQLAERWLGPNARPVRAVAFNKSATTNWSLGWHQDRTIAVLARREVAGFGAWSRKGGGVHVEPPFYIIEAMVTLRVHVDDVDDDNAPLLIAPGSHRLGRVRIGDIAMAVARCGSSSCLARAGDVWAYRTPILHASERAAKPRQRRVLQVDYTAEDLPAGLQWAGV